MNKPSLSGDEVSIAHYIFDFLCSFARRQRTISRLSNQDIVPVYSKYQVVTALSVDKKYILIVFDNKKGPRSFNEDGKGKPDLCSIFRKGEKGIPKGEVYHIGNFLHFEPSGGSRWHRRNMYDQDAYPQRRVLGGDEGIQQL